MMRAAVIVALSLACLAPAHAQAPIPRTPDGRPDFTGVWWTPSLTPIDRMEGAKGLTASDDEAKAFVATIYARARSPEQDTTIDPEILDADIRTLARVNGEWRTSLVVDPSDGKMPRTTEAQGLLSQRQLERNRPAEGPEVRTHFERCIAGAGRAPLANSPSFNMRRLVQTASHLMIYTEYGGDARVIGIGKPPRPSAMTSPLGDSTARWEGDTLVIETLRQRGEPFLSVVVRVESRVVERLTPLFPDEVLYQYTIEDPAYYVKPWRAEFSLHRTDKPIFEYACHEANYGLANILSGAREMERRAAAKPRP